MSINGLCVFIARNHTLTLKLNATAFVCHFHFGMRGNQLGFQCNEPFYCIRDVYYKAMCMYYMRALVRL